jgi:hypothetical protein
MADIKLNTANGSVTLKPQDGTGNVDITVPRVGFGKYSIGKIVHERTTASASTSSTTLQDLFTWTNNTGFTGGSIIHLHMYIPYRNTAGDWGGMRFEPDISFDNGTTWYGLGHTGYGEMNAYVEDIVIQQLDAMVTIPSSATQVKLKYRIGTYNGTVYVNDTGQSDLDHTGNGQMSNPYPGMTTANHEGRMHYTITEYIPTGA